MSERTDLTGRLDRLAGEWAGGVTPAAPERVRARGRHRRQRRIAAGAVLACAALAAVLVPTLRGGILGGEAVAPAGGGTSGFAAPAAARGEIRVRISDPPSGMPSALTLGGLHCTQNPYGRPDLGLLVTGTVGSGGRQYAAELYPTLTGPVITASFDSPGGAVGISLNGSTPQLGIIKVKGAGTEIELIEPDGRRGRMTGRYTVLDAASGTTRPHPTGRLAFDWWCPAP
jgi:hypothetical protein